MAGDFGDVTDVPFKGMNFEIKRDDPDQDDFEIACDSSRTVRDEIRTDGTGNTWAAARTDAWNKAVKEAMVAALRSVDGYTCPEKCPQLKSVFRIWPPKIVDTSAGVAAGGTPDYKITLSADWAVKLTCKEYEIKGLDLQIQEQVRVCSDPLETVDRRFCKGEGEGLVHGIDKKAADDAKEAAKNTAHLRLKEDVELRILVITESIKCGTACPVRHFEIFQGPIEDTCTDPEIDNGMTTVKCTSTRRVEFKAKCVEDE